jgi:hypothetical protein
MPPGTHTITLKKKFYEDKELAGVTFTAGQATTISGSDARLTPWGYLEFHVTPENAVLNYRREGDAAQTAGATEKVHVRPGTYTVTATLGDRTDRKTVSLEPGGNQPVTLSVVAAAVKKETKAAPVKLTNEYFEDPASWSLMNGWWIHRGDGMTYLRTHQGVFEFSVMHPTSDNFKSVNLKKRKVVWVIDERPKNQVEYTLDAGGLERKATVNGKGQKSSPKVAVPRKGETHSFRIEVLPEKIVVSAGGEVLDTYERPEPAAPMGKFGFKGEAALVFHAAEAK